MSSGCALAVAAILHVASAGATVLWCRSMSAMPGMPMAGGWTMSMMWMRMPDQSWPGAAASFLGMWMVMTTAMMLPSLVPVLRRYRDARLGDGTSHPDCLTALAGLAYFGVWAGGGLVAYGIGMTVATLEMRQPALARLVPLATGIVVATSGALQFTDWKARRLACCRRVPHVAGPSAGPAAAGWYGVRLGRDCVGSCAGLMTIQMVMGMMDIGVMAVVTAAITAERIAPAGARVAQAIGVVAVAGGLLLVAHAVVFG
jgi:predicted metal-binding membrane protein